MCRPSLNTIPIRLPQMAKTPRTKGGYVRVDGLDTDQDEDEDVASIKAHWGRHFGFASAMAYTWVTPIFKLGMRRQINLEDLPPLNTGPLYWQQLELEPLLAKTKEVLEDVRSNGTTGVRASLMWIFCGRVFLRDLLLASACDTTVQVINLINPVFMREFIAFMGSPHAPLADGLKLALWLFLLTAVMQPIQNLSFLIGGTTGAKQRAVMNALLFQKALRLSNEARQGSSVGQIVNLMSNDANRFQEFGWFAISMWLVPVYLAVAIAMLINMLGVSALSGIVVLVISLAINKRMMMRLHKLRTTQLHQTDDRVKQTNEAVLGIRVVKLYTWEQSIEERIAALRAVELEQIRTTERLMAVNRFMFFSIPVITAVVTFVTFTMLGNEMDPSLVFSSMALLNLIQEYLQQLPRAVAIVTQVLVAQGRIKTFLDSTELDPPAGDLRTETVAADSKGEIILEDVSVNWEKAAASPVLSGLNLRARAGELIAVVGAVGSGKSTILAAMLGEMHQTRGRVVSRGTIAYCAQQPWLISGTLRDNVLYGRALDEQRYNDTIRACGLLEDLEQLPGGDETIIGERGINISGGQKQRIALARALYRQADLYLLDDVLAAVDVHVGEHLMTECICGMMGGSTRVLVTNALHVLPRCDYIYVCAGGTIAESGTYDELLDQDDSLLVAMGATSSSTPTGTPRATAEADKDEADPKATAVTPKGNTADALVKAEDRKYGKVQLSTYYRYCKSGASDAAIVLILVLGYLGPELLSVGSQLWLSEWSSVSAGRQQSASEILYFQGVYAFLALSAMGVLLARAWVWADVVVKAAQRIHEQLLASILRLPVSFFDRTPTGRILNRFSSDIDQIDALLSQSLSAQCEFTVRAATAISVCIFVVPPVAVVLVPVFMLYVHYGNLFRASSREIRRLDATTRSPVYAHFGETLAGLSTIRSFGDSDRFIQHNKALLEGNLITRWSDALTQRWLNFRFDQVSAGLIGTSLLSAVYLRESLSGGLVGMMLVQLFSSVRSFRMTLKGYVNLEAQMTYAERVFEFIDEEQEPPRVLASDPASDWPSGGAITIKDASLRYRPGLPLALNGVSIEILPKERVGICGRTGSGKSTLTLALFRIVELVSGSIELDGRNVAELGLQTLRRALTIIPQDPVRSSAQLFARKSNLHTHTV